MTKPDPILAKIDAYYSGKLRDYGPTPRGVDWNSVQSQEVRFQQLARVLPEGSDYSILDYGCGYGAFLDFLAARDRHPRYCGFDVSNAMIESARALHAQNERAAFSADSGSLQPADFVVASGIFSVKMDVPTAEWENYVHATIERMHALSRKGFAFNLLTSYSDPERMRTDLYYAVPARYFDLCEGYSRWVALLHDYGLYEFTLVVRKP
ncbi:MAG TPA: class I SAM-dependent methyltransferase [Candidatus Acidoferrales bacterium]|nr:class I SAM-dependent methyltransferase [Candidatus Acidoferrales bacterium]